MKRFPRTLLLISSIAALLLCSACSRSTNLSSSSPQELYTALVSGADDNDKAAFLSLDGVDIPLLAVTDVTYDDYGCKVTTSALFYACIDGKIVDVGNLGSGGTAYPISYSGGSIYTANGHAVFRYELDSESQELKLAETACAVYDSVDGSVTCTTTYEGPDADRTADPETALSDLFEEYGNAKRITFFA